MEGKVTRLSLKDDLVEVELNKIETDEEKAELWELDETSTANSKLTFVMINRLIPIEAIYDRETNELLLFSVRLDSLCTHTRLIVEYNDGLKAEVDLRDLEEAFELIGINRVDEDGNKVFSTPTYLYEDEHGNKGKIKLWLNEHGHRVNQLHLSFVNGVYV